MSAIQAMTTGAVQTAQISNASARPASTGTKPAAAEAPTVQVSSAAKSFAGMADLILSNVSSASDGDESASGQEVNDHDADDAPAPTPSVAFSDAGTYSLNVLAA